MQLEGWDGKLHISDQYKHLGGIIHAGDTLGPELAARARAQAAALAPLRRAVFRQRAVEDRDAVTLCDSLTTSVLMFNAATWSELTLSQAKLLDHRRAEAYRQALRLPHNVIANTKLSHADVFRKAARPSTELALRRLRLCYLPRMLREAPVQLLLGCSSRPASAGPCCCSRTWSGCAPSPPSRICRRQGLTCAHG